MSEQKRSYYNDLYLREDYRTGAWYTREPTTSRLRLAASLIPQGSKVFDFGCGPGWFAECIEASVSIKRYVGIDFSEQAISIAQNTFGANHDVFSFHKHDIREEIDLDFDRDSIIVCCETLEHIENDLDVIALWPSNVPILISLPTFGGESHVRTFKHDSDIVDRYKNVLDLRNVVFHTITNPHDQGIIWRTFKTQKHEDV